jgi:hypothetical protein
VASWVPLSAVEEVEAQDVKTSVEWRIEGHMEAKIASMTTSGKGDSEYRREFSLPLISNSDILICDIVLQFNIVNSEIK